MGDVDSERYKTLIDGVSSAGERSQKTAAFCVHTEQHPDCHCVIHKVTEVRCSLSFVTDCSRFVVLLFPPQSRAAGAQAHATCTHMSPLYGYTQGVMFAHFPPLSGNFVQRFSLSQQAHMTQIWTHLFLLLTACSLPLSTSRSTD